MHCNIPEEFEKATAWAEKHNKPVTAEFFTGWLDRIFKPIENKEEDDARKHIEEARARVALRDEASRRSNGNDI
jgi:hypothetical protein